MPQTLLYALLGLAMLPGSALGAGEAITIENPSFRYRVSTNAVNLALVEQASGRGLLRAEGPCATARISGAWHAATHASFVDNVLALDFAAAVQAHVAVHVRPEAIVFEVTQVSPEVEALTFLDIPLDLAASPDEPVGACVQALNLITRVDALPVLQRDLRASAERKFGIIGAKAAVVVGPTSGLLRQLQQVLSTSSELPVCRVAGPWAREIPFNHGSYLFNFGSLTESNVTDWIEAVRRVGFNQIDNHGGGGFFRFGDFVLNPKKWPDGWDGYRRIVRQLHDAGIGSIFHTYAFFIDKGSRYVTPVPDPRLDAFRTFTLAQPVTADATEMVVNEPTAGMSTVTGFFEHNSVVLHVGDELLTFAGFSREAPWRFTGLKRGAHRTTAAPHPAGASARHLKECFGLLVPNPESSLFEEIAANHAEIVNRCDFDGLYLDAIDGSSILRGNDEVWYWANKFVVEIQRRLKKPVGMEMSAMWHHFWQYRTRWQAWDYPQRGHKRFIDLHAAAVNGGLMLPLHLGWWGFQSYRPPQIEPTFPDVMEHLGARLVGWDAGISLTAGVDASALERTPLFARAAQILRQCEDLRHTRAFDEAARARLRDPDEEFSMTSSPEGALRFRPTRSHAHTFTASEPWSAGWLVTNPFTARPMRLRIEALPAVVTTDANAVVLAEANTAWQVSATEPLRAEIVPPSDPDGLARLHVSHPADSGLPRTAAWVRLQKRFEPALSAKEAKGLVVTVDSDRSGALLAFRLESPHHVAHGAVADRYLRLDFQGTRILALVETESERWSDYTWNDGKSLYHVYREAVDFGALESMSVWLQDIPSGTEVRVGLGAIRAVPLRQAPLKDPRLTVGDTTVTFLTELSPGSWIEGNGPEDCVAFDLNGARLGSVKTTGGWPGLREGQNSLTLRLAEDRALPPRLKVTTFADGDPL